MLFVKGKLKNTYNQVTRKNTSYNVHEFEEQAKSGATLIQRVKDFECTSPEIGKVIEMPVFISGYVNKAGNAAFELVRIGEKRRTAPGI